MNIILRVHVSYMHIELLLFLQERLMRLSRLIGKVKENQDPLLLTGITLECGWHQLLICQVQVLLKFHLARDESGSEVTLWASRIGLLMKIQTLICQALQGKPCA